MTHSNNREVTRRTDGEKTKAKIIAEAMRLTAERGYNGVTSKEICEASGVNTALVSYYFGSRKKLHQEVLKCAHDQLFSMEEMKRIFNLPISAEEKLKEFLSHLYKREKNSAIQQAIRIFLWEIRSPSEAFELNVETTILPKFSLLLQLASQISGLPTSSLELRKSMFFVLAPCVMAIMFPNLALNTIFKLGPTSDDQFIVFVWKQVLEVLKQTGIRFANKEDLHIQESIQANVSAKNDPPIQGEVIVI